MTSPSDLPSLYSQRPISLWVEDEETRAYLDRCWQDSDIGYLVAGGSENVGAVVKAARVAGIPTVFGLRDRDFNESNRGRWRDLNSDIAVFTLESLEVENLALDARSIAETIANTDGLIASDIEALLCGAASTMVWCMSCRYTIAGIREAVAANFPKHPKPDGQRAVGSFTAARDWILRNPWWQEVLATAKVHLTATSVELVLHWQHEACAQMIVDGRWKRGFSGKEILSASINSIWRKARPPTARRDLLMMVAEQQRSTGALPPEVVELHAALRARAGLAPMPV